MCKGFLVSHVEIGLQVGTRNLGTVLQLETHLSVTGGIKQLHTFLGVNGKVTNAGILAAGLRVIIVGF